MVSGSKHSFGRIICHLKKHTFCEKIPFQTFQSSKFISDHNWDLTANTIILKLRKVVKTLHLNLLVKLILPHLLLARSRLEWRFSLVHEHAHAFTSLVMSASLFQSLAHFSPAKLKAVQSFLEIGISFLTRHTCVILPVERSANPIFYHAF